MLLHIASEELRTQNVAGLGKMGRDLKNKGISLTSAILLPRVLREIHPADFVDMKALLTIGEDCDRAWLGP